MSKLSDLIKNKNKASDEKAANTSLIELSIASSMNKLFYYDRKLREDRVGLHASALISTDTDFCYREQILSLFFKQNEANHPLGLKRIFEQGIAIHEKWQNLFTMQGIAQGIEYRCYSDEWNLYLTPDAIVTCGGKTYIAEIKSMNGFAFQKAKSHPSGQKQMQIYMHFLGIPRAFVLAEDKNTQDIKIFYEEYDPEKVRPYLERLHKIKKFKRLFMKKPSLPPKQCKSCTTKRAERCNMKDACFNMSRGRIWLQDHLITKPEWAKK